MNLTSLHWWFGTNSGLHVRIAIGVSIFALLAVADLLRNGRAATRWREYAFLFLCGALGAAYGIVNDAITSSISWEYFYYGKGLAEVMPAQTPPDAWALKLQAMQIGAQTAGTAALVLGAMLLIANNPRAGRRRLTYRQLSRYLLQILASTLACALLLGAAGSKGWLLWTSSDLTELWNSGEMRPVHFLGVYGIHLGGYVGGAIGAVAALLRIARIRRGPV